MTAHELAAAVFFQKTPFNRVSGKGGEPLQRFGKVFLWRHPTREISLLLKAWGNGDIDSACERLSTVFATILPSD
jgi:hypothetical protein